MSARWFNWSFALALLVSIVACGAAGGLAVSWLRQQIAQSAARVAAGERELARVERRRAGTEARVAQAEHPDALLAGVARHRLELQAPGPGQTVRLTPRRVPQIPDGPADYGVAFALTLPPGAPAAPAPAPR